MAENQNEGVKTPEVETAKAEKPRDESGKFKRANIVDETMSAIEEDPGILRALLERMRSSTTLMNLYDSNKKAAMLAAQSKAGTVALTKLRKNLIQPMLPEQWRPALDHKLLAAGFDLGAAFLVGAVAQGMNHKLPEKVQPYTLLVADSLTYAAWNNGLDLLNIETFIGNVLAGDIFETFKDVVALHNEMKESKS